MFLDAFRRFWAFCGRFRSFLQCHLFCPFTLALLAHHPISIPHFGVAIEERERMRKQHEEEDTAFSILYLGSKFRHGE